MSNSGNRRDGAIARRSRRSFASFDLKEPAPTGYNPLASVTRTLGLGRGKCLTTRVRASQKNLGVAATALLGKSEICFLQSEIHQKSKTTNQTSKITMSIDPQVRQLLNSVARAGLPPVYELSPAAARQQMVDGSAALGDPEPIHRIRNESIPVPDGSIAIRIYHPSGQNLPVVVYFHGGGWVMGSIETHDGYCRLLANAARAIVVSVDYRLAPEHKFPTAAEDAYTATCWASEQAEAIGGRSGPVVVAGDSAGGNLAAVVALMARDRLGPSIGGQILIYPITDCDLNTESYRAYSEGYFLTRPAMEWFWDQYCLPDTDRQQAYLSPLRSENLSDLPPGLIVTAEYDPLRDEAEAYADRLRQAGVEVELSRYAGMIHGFTRRFRLLDQARQALYEVAAMVRRPPRFTG